MGDDDIKRKAAIDAVHKSIIDFFDICDDDEESPMTYKDKWLLELNKAITTQIKAVPSTQSVTLMHWIPCSERLPQNERKTYWVCTDVGSQHECRWTNNRYGLCESGTWGWSIFDIPQFTEVVAWMPLPKPYKKDGKQE